MDILPVAVGECVSSFAQQVHKTVAGMTQVLCMFPASHLPEKTISTLP